MQVSGSLIWLELWRWPIEPQLTAAVVVGAWLHARGTAVQRREGDLPPVADRAARWRAIAFYVALVGLVVTLESPLDTFSGVSFAWHMSQHMLLYLVIPPLLVVSAPWESLIAGLPAEPRRRVTALRGRLAGSFSGVGEAPGQAVPWRAYRSLRDFAANPTVALAVFTGYLWVWHLPATFDLTLVNPTVHDLEHVGYLAVGLLFWSRVIDSAPLRSVPSYFVRIVYLLGGLGACWMLGMFLAFASTPLYRPYLHMAAATKASVMGSQALGAGIMWAPGMVPFDVLFALYVQRLLRQSAERDEMDGERELQTRAGRSATAPAGAATVGLAVSRDPVAPPAPPVAKDREGVRAQR